MTISIRNLNHFCIYDSRIFFKIIPSKTMDTKNPIIVS